MCNKEGKMKTEKEISDAIGKLQAIREKFPKHSKDYARLDAKVEALFWVRYSEFGDCWLDYWRERYA